MFVQKGNGLGNEPFMESKAACKAPLEKARMANFTGDILENQLQSIEYIRTNCTDTELDNAYKGWSEWEIMNDECLNEVGKACSGNLFKRI